MNEIPPGDQTDYFAKPPMTTVIGALALFHLVCCGLPLLLLSGVVSFPDPFPAGARAACLHPRGFCVLLRPCSGLRTV